MSVGLQFVTLDSEAGKLNATQEENAADQSNHIE